MKTKLIGVLALLAGSTLFAAPRVYVGVGIGAPAYGYGYVAPPPPPPAYYSYAAPAPVYVAPPAYYPERVWVNGYWGFYGGRREWHPGYWRPRGEFRHEYRERGRR